MFCCSNLSLKCCLGVSRFRSGREISRRAGTKDLSFHPTDTLGFRSRLDFLHAKTFIKCQDDGFHEQKFSEFVKKQGWKNLIIMGLNASACVLWTTYGALQQGYQVLTSSDIIMDSKEHIEHNNDEGLALERSSTYKHYAVFRDTHQELMKMVVEGKIPEKK